MAVTTPLLIALLATEPAPASLVPPRLVEPLAVELDAALRPSPERPVEVVVRLRVTDTGEVDEVALIQSGGAAYDELVLIACTHARFEPATLDGVPVSVEIAYTQRFEGPPPAAAPPTGPPLSAELSGTIVEQGTRMPLPFARIAVRHAAGTLTTESQRDGSFVLAVPEGELDVEVDVAGARAFRVQERVASGQALAVRYLVERLSYDPYETIVVGKRERQEVSRTELEGRELRHVPGTFGDPFRVIQALPGVGQMMSLLAYPIVRGTSPGNTGFLLDGVRLPQLFHLLAGPAVIHPEFIERVDFYPGSFPVAYGGYTGGVIDGITRRPRTGERRLDVDIDLTKAGGFYRGPADVVDGELTVAGRYGYPGLLLRLFQSDAILSYWDYQVRYDRGDATSHWQVFAFGAFDELGERNDDGPDETLAKTVFHRLDVRHERRGERFTQGYDLVLGIDQVLSNGDASELGTLVATPRAHWEWKLAEPLTLRAGVEGMARKFTGKQTVDGEDIGLATHMLSAGAYLDAPFRPSGAWLFVPGVRIDHYENDRATQTSFDPRVLARRRLATREAGETWLKAGVGLYHQPARFIIPIPGLEDLALERGLLRTLQTSLGVEHPFTELVELDATAYYHHMDPILFDLMTNEESTDAPAPDEDEGSSDVADLFARRKGRSYGLELMLRRRDGTDLFGWVAYTLSVSERWRDGAWIPFDFDRTHMMHVVLGVKLPRNWEVGGRFQLQSARPVTTDQGYNRGREGEFYRFDLRVDKRAVWNEWLLDFYVDVINVSLSPENPEGSSSGGFRYLLPTLGFRAVL